MKQQIKKIARKSMAQEKNRAKAPKQKSSNFKKYRRKEDEEEVRLNKFISHNSRYSRREADALIFAGDVSVNDKTVTNPATSVTIEDKVTVKGQFVRKAEQFTVFVYNKPKGELVTKKDDRGRKTIYHALPTRLRHYIPVGRLDYASEGLLLLTDSPEVATILMTSHLERIYNLKIAGDITPQIIQSMEKGLSIVDSKEGAHEYSNIDSMDISAFSGYKILKNHKNYSRLRVSITEGKNRELRRFFANLNREIVDLKRIAFGGIELNNLPTGKHRYLSRKEYEDLRAFLKEKKIELKELKDEKELQNIKEVTDE